MPTAPLLVTLAGCLVLGYLLGSLSGSLLLGRLRGVDIRSVGSGNAGGTNAFRTQGAMFALGVVLLDVGKAALATLAGWAIALELAQPVLYGALPAAAGAVLGHNYPLYFGFRGGKGAATLVGAIAVLLPVAILPLLGLWLVVLIVSGYVGLATILAGLAFPMVTWLLAAAEDRSLLMLFSLFAALLIVFSHRSNLSRLVNGNEHRFERVRLFHRWLKR